MMQLQPTKHKTTTKLAAVFWLMQYGFPTCKGLIAHTSVSIPSPCPHSDLSNSHAAGNTNAGENSREEEEMRLQPRQGLLEAVTPTAMLEVVAEKQAPHPLQVKS